MDLSIVIDKKIKLFDFKFFSCNLIIFDKYYCGCMDNIFFNVCR